MYNTGEYSGQLPSYVHNQLEPPKGTWLSRKLFRGESQWVSMNDNFLFEHEGEPPEWTKIGRLLVGDFSLYSGLNAIEHDKCSGSASIDKVSFGPYGITIHEEDGTEMSFGYSTKFGIPNKWTPGVMQEMQNEFSYNTEELQAISSAYEASFAKKPAGSPVLEEAVA